ncbi:MAG: anti-sigma factor domain-containing protein [Thermomicrobiales bacterium]
MSEITDDLPFGRGGATGGAPGPHVACAYVHDLTAGFAFGALDPDEHVVLDAHCNRCPPCAHLLDQARQTATLLSFTAPPTRPPAHVKASLFIRIAHSMRDEPEATPAFTLPSPSTLPAAAAAPFRTNAGKRAGGTQERRFVPRLNQPRRIFGSPSLPRWQSVVIPLATVPLVLALAIVGGFAVTAQSRVSDLRQDLSRAQGEAERLQATVDAMDGFVRTEDAMVYSLPAREDGSSQGQGKVVVNPGTTDAMLLVWGLPPSTSGASYQVYLERKGGKWVPAGQFHVDNEGRGTAVLALDQPFTAYEAVHVKPSGRPQIDEGNPTSGGDTLATRIDPNVGELLDTDQPKTR